jgi:peptidyl-prolyl cis-trans isomerase D
MFEIVDKHKRLLQFFLVLIIGPTFLFFGIESYNSSSVSSGEVAEVGGAPITTQEFEQALSQQRNRLRSTFGGNIDPAMFDTPEARKELLDSLIDRRVLLDYTYRRNMVAGDAQIRDFIANYPAFQEDGQFSRARYDALLRAQNLSPAGFEAQLRTDIALEQLTDGLAQSAFVSEAVAQRFAVARAESREISRAVLTAGQFTAQAKVTPEDIETYYKNNPKEFETPEQVRAAYVTLNRDDLAAQEKISPEEVQKQYDARVAPQAKAREEAHAKAEEVLAELRKDPSRFEELARKYSQDSGSAAQGGDLGFFGRGAMVKPFEDAVFKLKPGEISPIVASDFGFHIIQLVEVKPGKDGERHARHILFTAPAAEKDPATARKEIEEELKRQAVARKYPEAAENFSNLAYEQPDSLQPLADRFHLKINESAGWLSRTAGRPPLDNPRLLEALFSTDAINGKQNTEAVEVAPGRLIVARVVEHRPAAMRKLDDVRDDIRKTLVERNAAQLAREAGAQKLKALQAGENAGLGWGEAKSVSRENPAGLDAEALAAVFKADAAKLPAYAGVAIPDGYAIYRIGKVQTPAQIDPQRARAAAFALAQLNARAQFNGFLEGLRERADIEINDAELQKVGRRGQ